MLKRLLLFLMFTVSILYATVPDEKSVTKNYIGTFDRAPDAAGLKYWVHSRLTLEKIAASFFEQPETTEKYPQELTNADFIIEIYANLFGRYPDTDGFEYWLRELENGQISRSLFILTVINGALGNDAKILKNKTEVGLAFARDGKNDIREAYEIMKGVTANPDSVNDSLCEFGLSGCVVPPIPIPPVKHKPIAVDDAYTMDKNTVLDNNVSTNDIPSLDGGNIWSKTTDPTHGTLIFNIDGTFTYTPVADYVGLDSFTYTLTDKDGDSSTATVNIMIIVRPFLIKVKTDNPGVSTNIQFTIPTTGGGYDYRIDCDNDGTDEASGQNGDYTCDYSTTGEYIIAIRGEFPRIYFNFNGDKNKLLSIVQWGTQRWKSFEKAFSGCSHLAGNTTDIPNLTEVTDMSLMFADAEVFNQNIGDWNTSNVTNMRYMFWGCSKFNQDISGWDTSKVINMRSMFGYAKVFSQDISGWDTSKVINMSGMFREARVFNKYIGDWNTSKVTDMNYMFQNANNFNQDISGWDTSKVTNMGYMFQNANNFNQDISGWDTSEVIYMGYMFENAISFNQDLSGWDITNVLGHDNFCNNWGGGTPPGGWTCP